jgi:hypothetical protein
LVVIQRGKRVAILQGELTFAYGYRLVIRERLSYDDTVVIEDYGYELWYSIEKIAWYDSQPHPDNPILASTHPHHKHLSLELSKQHEANASEMSEL